MIQTDNPTRDILVSMLQENTGRHMLDSGGAYGRHWERNQHIPREAWDNLVPVTWDRYGVTIQVLPWLEERLQYIPEADAFYQDWCERHDPEHESYDLELAARFAETYGTSPGYFDSGNPLTVNTYNGEDALSQTLQYILFSIREDYLEDVEDDSDILPECIGMGEDWLLLQVHGGCDVRGGYTTPRLFYVPEFEAILDNARVWGRCYPEDLRDPSQGVLEGVPAEGPPESHIWDSDDAGYSWYPDGCYVTPTPSWEDFFPVDEDGDILEDDGPRCPICGARMEFYA